MMPERSFFIIERCDAPNSPLPTSVGNINSPEFAFSFALLYVQLLSTVIPFLSGVASFR